MGNSAYGSLLMRVDKHRRIKYSSSKSEVTKQFNDKSFKKFTQIDTDLFEVESSKKTVRYSMPIQVGFFVLCYAKLRMLDFYYNFVDKYVSRNDFEYCCMDTDSAYITLSTTTLKESIKPALQNSYDHMLNGHCSDAIVYAPT